MITGLWFFNSYQDWRENKQRGRLYRMRMHFFCSAACFFNMMASVDLKGVAARLPLLFVEICNELAYSCLLCVMFHMVNQWVDVITLKGVTTWGQQQRQMLPIMCATVTCLRVGLGVAQWKVVRNGVHNGCYNGSLNNVKLFTSFFAMGIYAAIGLYASVYEPLMGKKVKAKKESSRSVTQGGSGIAVGEGSGSGNGKRGRAGSAFASALESGLRRFTSKAADSAHAMQRKKVLNTRKLVGLFGILFLYVLYLGSIAAERVGEVSARGVPCSFVSKNW